VPKRSQAKEAHNAAVEDGAPIGGGVIRVARPGSRRIRRQSCRPRAVGSTNFFEGQGRGAEVRPN